MTETTSAAGPAIRAVDTAMGKTWVVTGYDLARRVFGDSDTFANAVYRAKFLAMSEVRPTEPDGSPVQTMASDPPVHTRIRRLVSQAFTARRVESMRPGMDELAARLIGELAAAGPGADLYRILALPFPSVVICRLLGVPESDIPKFRGWSDTLTETAETVDMAAARAAKSALGDYFTELIALRQRTPEDNLLSALIHKRDGDVMTTAELQSLAQIILLAGLETTVNQIGVGIVRLLTHREHWERIVADPSLIPATVEELLRIETVAGDGLPGVPRYTTREVELDGETIPADTVIWVNTGLANLDEAKFPNPHAFDLDRGLNQHLSFGHGIHHCLGAHLARVQVQVVFAKLAELMPTLRLAVDPAELTIVSTMARGYRHIPVTW